MVNLCYNWPSLYAVFIMDIEHVLTSADDLPKPKTTDVIRKGSLTEYTAAEEKEDGRRWRMFRIGEQDHRVDMKAIEPYKKVISHGGKN